MKKYMVSIMLMMMSYAGVAQELTSPQVVGYPTGRSISVSFPFNITGIPFKDIPGSVWNAKSTIIAELHMTYYMEGDATRYGNKTVKKVNLGPGGSWTITDLTVEPHPYAIPNKRMVEGKTVYGLFIFQEYNKQMSSGWNATVNRQKGNVKFDKILDQKLGPKVVHPKDKVILNPQPIPPKTSKKIIKN